MKRREGLQIPLSPQDKQHVWLTISTLVQVACWGMRRRRGCVRWGDEGWGGAAVGASACRAEDEARSLAPLAVLLLHLGWEIRLQRDPPRWDSTSSEVQKPGSRARWSQAPAAVSQKHVAPAKRWAHIFPACWARTPETISVRRFIGNPRIWSFYHYFCFSSESGFKIFGDPDFYLKDQNYRRQQGRHWAEVRIPSIHVLIEFSFNCLKSNFHTSIFHTKILGTYIYIYICTSYRTAIRTEESHCPEYVIWF